MGFGRISLGEDRVDVYNHTYSAILFISLALGAWLLPFSSPVYQSEENIIKFTIRQKPPLKVKAACWCPAQFTAAHEEYSNAVCEQAYKRDVLGLTNGSFPGGIYKLKLRADSRPENNDVVKPDFPSKTKKHLNKHNGQNKTNNIQQEHNKKADDASYFIHMTTPTTLFLLALAVKIPHLLYSLLVPSFAGLNVDQTLRAATSIAGPSTNDRQEIQKQLATRAIQHSGRTAGTLYLLLKLLTCVTAVTSLLVVHGMMLPRAARLGDMTESFGKAPDTRIRGFHKKVMSTKGAQNKVMPVDENYSLYNAPGQVYLCDMAISFMKNRHHYTLQCLFNIEESALKPVRTKAPEIEETHVTKPYSYFELYETLFLVVQSYLVILTIVNISSFSLWVGRLLASPCCDVTGHVHQRALPLDAIFLLQMARENTGLDVVATFTQTFLHTE